MGTEGDRQRDLRTDRQSPYGLAGEPGARGLVSEYQIARVGPSQFQRACRLDSEQFLCFAEGRFGPRMIAGCAFRACMAKQDSRPTVKPVQISDAQLQSR